MPGSTTSVFSEPDDYQAALQLDGGFELVITRPGAFRAELTRIELPRMRLMAGCERLARIGFLTQAPDLIRIVLPMRHGGLLFSGGIVSRPDELVTYAPGQRIHERTDGPCHWRSIWLPVEDLLRYGHAVIGRSFEIPDGLLRWRPKREALNRLSHLHNHAIHTSKVEPRVFAAAQATRGLEQELIANLIDCMQGTAPNLDAVANVRRTVVMNRFEGLLVKSADAPPSIPQICAALGIPDRTLRAYCLSHLGLGPHRYLHLRQMQRIRQELRAADPSTIRIADLAHRYGFRGLGRFAASYREQYGELPSDTKRQRAVR